MKQSVFILATVTSTACALSSASACVVLPPTPEEQLYQAATGKRDVEAVVVGRTARDVKGLGQVRFVFNIERTIRGKKLGKNVAVRFFNWRCRPFPIDLSSKVDRVLYLKEFDTGWDVVAQADLSNAAKVDPQIARLFPLHARVTPNGASDVWMLPKNLRPKILSRLPVITEDDYPPIAQRDGAEGLVKTRLSVGLDGRVISCTIVASSGSSLLDDTTCRLFTRRLRYEPFVQSGRAVIFYTTIYYRWSISR